MLRPFIRVLAFFAKELAELRRQPRLLLSLVLGPFLILLLFGLGFTGERPRLRTIVVVPPELENDPRLQNFTNLINETSFEVVEVMTDEQAALAQMEQGRDDIDVVEILPNGVDDIFERREQAQIRVVYDEIDPTQEQWIQYLSYVQTKELNTAILVSAVSSSRERAGTISDSVAEMREELESIEAGLDAADDPQTRASVRRLRNNTGLLAAGLALSSQSESNQRAQQNISELQRNLEALDQALEEGRIEEQRERIDHINQQLDELQQLASRIEAVPPEVLVSPLEPAPQNLAEQQPTFIAFYAPGVLALLLQHMAITMAGLSLVRERLLGSTELFRVAPVSSIQILLGKYIGFIVFTALVIALLVALMVLNVPIGGTGYRFGLGVPFVGSPVWFGVALLLVTIASLSAGFLISAVSQTESQAVQLSMIMLLASIFFSGFFISLRNFAQFVHGLALLLPVTHGVQMFQTIMLRGTLPAISSLAWLAGIGLFCFMLSWYIWRADLRRR